MKNTPWKNITNEAGNLSSSTCCFCTIASREYTLKALALYSSLKEHCSSFHLWICCMDEEIYSILKVLSLKEVTPLRLNKIETPELLAVKPQRATNEYCWTLKPFILKHVLSTNNINALIYLDSDMFFYDDPASIFEDFKNHSVLLCPQRDLEWVHQLYGYYQAGFVGFRKDGEGLRALNWWAESCLANCSRYPQQDLQLFGDQKYLDKIPGFFSNVLIYNHLGVDAAPWNLVYNNNFNTHMRNNKIYIDDYPLKCFHFACINIYNQWEYDLWTFNKIYFKDIIMEKIYIPYIERIGRIIEYLTQFTEFEVKRLLNPGSPLEAKTYFRHEDGAGMATPAPLVNLPPTILAEDYQLNFCTIVSKTYVIRVLALYLSLRKNAPGFHLYICAMDDKAYDLLTAAKLKRATIFKVEDLENEALLREKGRKGLMEYCWTIKPSLIIHVMEKYYLHSVIYTDADMYFFSSCNELLEEWKGYSVFMCRQRESLNVEKLYGGFQAGLLGFSRDVCSMAILNWWRDKCIEWCYDNIDEQNQRWGDQKYLDLVPNLFSNIKVISHPGINAAPWNLVWNNSYQINSKEGMVYIDNHKLVCFHFGSMKIFNTNEFELWKHNPVQFDEHIRNHIYIPYINELKNVIKRLSEGKASRMPELFTNEAPRKAQNYFKL